METKPASEYTSTERREIFARLAKGFAQSFTPSVGNRLSGQQIAAAKGLAWKAMKKAGF